MIDDIRRSRRIKASVGTVLRADDSHYVLETGDLSETGLFLRMKRPFRIGTRLRIVLGQPPHLPRTDAVGVVKRSVDGQGVGVEFTSISLEHWQNLLRFMNSISL